MRIDGLLVSNFRALTRVVLEGLKDTVVIAGPNGCGKSCIFDAIRLLKSAYGGYQANEWNHWAAEFQININQPGANLLPVFQDRTKDLLIQVTFSLAPKEQVFLNLNAKQILTDQVWQEIVPEAAGWQRSAAPLAANLRVHQPEVDRRVNEQLPEFLKELAQATHTGELVLSPNGEGSTKPSRVLEIIFGRYDPHNIGIIDYHGAARNYAREQVGGINLSIESSEQRMRNHALYNYSNKYANLKTEMAASFVRQLLITAAEPGATPDPALNETLKVLFQTFFPGKEFLGTTATRDGRLLFPVKTANGSQHDIDDLSSGEKEVLYGYLRLRDAAPRHSVLLIDEPELHLNPRLLRGLASFYHEHLAKPLGTQLWLVTHSDTMIREAVGRTDFSVFHLQPPTAAETLNQMSPVKVSEDVERVVVELVGDLAAYRPEAKMVIFEGDTETGFDVRFTCMLFPEFQARVNPLGGGNKRMVEQLYQLLDRARSAGHIPGKFCAITDSDGEPPAKTVAHCYSWDVYHIENYLLVPRFVLKVLNDLNEVTAATNSETAILDALRACAQQTTDQLVAHKLRTTANSALLGCLDLGYDPARLDVAAALSEALERAHSKIGKARTTTLTKDVLEEAERKHRKQLAADLNSEEWLKTFRGRDILRLFVGRHVNGIAYEQFRDLVGSSMRDAKYQPPGMKAVIDTVLSK